MSERDRMEFALSRGIAAVAGRQVVFAARARKVARVAKRRTETVPMAGTREEAG
jgi:hypothetical protein